MNVKNIDVTFNKGLDIYQKAAYLCAKYSTAEVNANAGNIPRKIPSATLGKLGSVDSMRCRLQKLQAGCGLFDLSATAPNVS